MKNFLSALKATENEMVCSAVELRFKNPEEFKTPEALIIYEQGILDEDFLFELVEQEYDKPLEIPKRTYLQSEIVDHFQGKDCIPLSYDNVNNVIHVAVLPEKENLYIEKWNNSEIEKHLVPIYYYVENFTRLYSPPVFLLELPEYDLLNYIVNEAIELGAADITLSSCSAGANIYYNIRKTKVNAKRRITKEEAAGICNFLKYKAGVITPDEPGKPVFFSLELNCHYRGRVAITPTYQGTLITIRMIENDIPMQGLDMLNISESTTAFIREIYASDEVGLRLVVGPAFSGKNTTVVSALYEKLSRKEAKAVSLELPVEFAVDFIEQIECLSEEEFNMAAASLLRQSPDIVYITDMLDTTAKAAIYAATGGKAVYTAMNANSIADSVLAIRDMTGLPLDRIIMGMQSAIFQELITGKNELRPVNRCLHFSKEFKDALLGLSQEDMVKAIRKEEVKWV